MSAQIFFHYGVVVADIAEASNFLQNFLGFKLIQERVIEHPYISELIGQADISAEVALLQIDQGSFIELLKWHTSAVGEIIETKSSPKLYEFGAQHICIFTEDIEVLYSNLIGQKSVEQVSSGIVSVEVGPNVGARVFFVKLFDCLFLEVFQKAS